MTNGIAQSATGRATKIEAVNESTVLTVGSEAQLRVKLVDPKNIPAKTDEDFTVKLEDRTISGTVETIDVVIKAGEDSQIARLPLNEPGPITVSASNKETVTGGIILNVRSAKNHAGAHLSTVTPALLSSSLASSSDSANRIELSPAPRRRIGSNVLSRDLAVLWPTTFSFRIPRRTS
jgi:hypothetical protein